MQNTILTLVLLFLLLCEATVHFFPTALYSLQKFYVVSKCRDENCDNSDSDVGLVI